MKYHELFGGKKPVIAMLHLKADARKTMLERAAEEIDAYIRAGVEAVLVENYFGSVNDCETVLRYLQAEKPDVLYGVNILGDYQKAFELSAKYGAQFIQIDSVCGHLRPAAEKAYVRDLNGLRSRSDAVVLGGVRFKYQPVRSGRSVEEDLKLGMERCDAIVVTGEGTGMATPQDKIRQFRGILGAFPLVVGAGVTPDTIGESLAVGDGAIVGSWFKQGHRDFGDVEPAYVEEFMVKKRQCV